MGCLKKEAAHSHEVRSGKSQKHKTEKQVEKMLSILTNERLKKRHEAFAKKENVPVIHGSLIGMRTPEQTDRVYSYWNQRGITSSGAPLF